MGFYDPCFFPFANNTFASLHVLLSSDLPPESLTWTHNMQEDKVFRSSGRNVPWEAAGFQGDVMDF